MTLRLCGAPSSSAAGLVVPFRVVATLAEPRVDPTIPGPTHLSIPLDAAALPWDAASGSEAPPIEAIATAAGAHQALYLLWQSGELAKWGRRRDVVSSVQRKLEDRLAFEVGAIVPHLPPTAARSADDRGAFRVRFGDLEIGRLDDGRRVFASGDVLGRARIESGRLGLSGMLDDLRVTCVEGHAGAWRLRPCLSDVVPVVRASGMTSEGLPLGLSLPDRLLRTNLVLGTELVLEGMHAEMRGPTPVTMGSTPVLHVRSGARLVLRKR